LEAEEFASKACSEENLQKEDVIIAGILQQKTKKTLGWKTIRLQAELRASALVLTDLTPPPALGRVFSNHFSKSTLPITKISSVKITSETTFEFTTVHDISLTLIAENTNILIAWHRNIEDQIAFAKDQALKTQVVSKTPFKHMYKMSKLMGRGQFGDVYAASPITSTTTYAVKVIDRQKILIQSNVDLQFLAREASVMRNLDHPHIVKLIDLFFEDRTIYIVTDLCLGGELQQRVLKLGGYSEMEAMLCIRNVLSAIDYCHTRNYVHRDMKPENILLVEQGDNVNIKIIDFGFAKAVDGTSMQFNTVLGTQLYMAPEVVNKSMSGYHNGLSPHKVDIWAIGCIAYFILACTSPFKKRNVVQCQKAILSGSVKFDQDVWNDVSDTCIEAIKAMLVVQPEGRLDACDVLQLPWFKSDSAAPETGTSSLEARAQNLNEYKLELMLGALLEPLFVHVCITGAEGSEVGGSAIFDSEDDHDETADDKVAREKNDRAIFAIYDKDKSGELDVEAMILVFKDLNIDLTDAQVEDTIKLVDVNNDGAIQLDEFHALMRLARASSNQKENVGKVFAHLDQNQDGFVTLEDFKEVVSDSAGGFGDLTDGLVQQLLGMLDSDGDGKVSLSDFEHAYTRFC
jgi:calcium-dependent protein kinase